MNWNLGAFFCEFTYLGPFLALFWLIFGAFLDLFWPIVWPFLDHFWTTFGPLLDHFWGNYCKAVLKEWNYALNTLYVLVGRRIVSTLGNTNWELYVMCVSWKTSAEENYIHRSTVLFINKWTLCSSFGTFLVSRKTRNLTAKNAFKIFK